MDQRMRSRRASRRRLTVIDSDPALAKNKRRLEQHRASHGELPLARSLVETLHVQFIKAYLPVNKLSRPRYAMRVTNSLLNCSWEMVRPFKDFFDLKERLVRVLDHGHMCSANCPWLYMFISHNFPRRHFFRSRQPSVISSRLHDLEQFMTTILHVLRETKTLECEVASQKLPQILYDFLCEGMVFTNRDLQTATDPTVTDTTRISIHKGQPDSGSSLSDQTSTSSSQSDACSICSLPLKLNQRNDRGSSDGEGSASASTTGSDGHVHGGSSSSATFNAGRPSSHLCVASVTTLSCGHQFHDECVLRKLNEALACPTCHKPQ